MKRNQIIASLLIFSMMVSAAGCKADNIKADRAGRANGSGTADVTDDTGADTDAGAADDSDATDAANSVNDANGAEAGTGSAAGNEANASAGADTGAGASEGTDTSADSSTTPADGSAYEAGDRVLFGNYRGGAISWIVLDSDGDNLMLLSEYIIDGVRYNEEETDVTWEDCSVRAWLNDEFMRSAFTSDEQDMILMTDVQNNDNPTYSSEGGNDTSDKVFLLSYEEAGALVPEEDLNCMATPYALDKGLVVYTDTNCSDWILRTPGTNNQDCAMVSGVISDNGCDVNFIVHCGIRPVIWVNAADARDGGYLISMSEVAADRDPEAPDNHYYLDQMSADEAASAIYGLLNVPSEGQTAEEYAASLGREGVSGSWDARVNEEVSYACFVFGCNDGMHHGENIDRDRIDYVDVRGIYLNEDGTYAGARYQFDEDYDDHDGYLSVEVLSTFTSYERAEEIYEAFLNNYGDTMRISDSEIEREIEGRRRGMASFRDVNGMYYYPAVQLSEGISGWELLVRVRIPKV